MSMEQNNVFSMLELSVKGQQETTNALTIMYEAMKKMAVTSETASKEAQEAKAQALLAVAEAREIRDEVRNTNYLYPAESNDLHDAVRERSIEIAKMNQVPEEKFTETVGKIRRRIWSDLKKRYGVAKYIYIPHKHYNDAIQFVHEFSLVN